jgi:hypothetical protein
MEPTTYEQMLDFLKKNDSFESIDTYTETELLPAFTEAVTLFFKAPRVNRCAVLGIDLYLHSLARVNSRRHPFPRSLNANECPASRGGGRLGIRQNAPG